MLITIVAFLAILAVLIIAHEFGHFITARAFGVKVEEFGLGFPPRLLHIKRGETIYSLNATPLGGFVRLAGEQDPSVPRSLASRRVGPRILILSAGSLMNILLPLLFFSIAFMIPSDTVIGQVVIREVAVGSPAATAGIEAGDNILDVNGKPIRNSADLQRNIQLNLGKEITILLRRDSVTKQVDVTPRWQPPQGQGAIGIRIEMLNPGVIKESHPPWEAVPLAVREGIDTLVLFKNGIESMVIGAAPVEVAGPVGIAQITGEVAKAGISPLLEFAAFLSINLAIINIFPLPALDGGRVAFALLEWVRRGKRISPKTEGLVHLIGFMVLIALVLVVTYQDIVRISGGNFLP